MHAKVAAQYAALVLGADGTSARGMMAPRVIAHELAEFIVSLNRIAREPFLDNQLAPLEFRRHRAHKFHAFDRCRSEAPALRPLDASTAELGVGLTIDAEGHS